MRVLIDTPTLPEVPGRGDEFSPPTLKLFTLPRVFFFDLNNASDLVEGRITPECC